jgi:hypothetical protein
MRILVQVVVLFVILCNVAEARIFRNFRATRNTTVSYSSPSSYSSPQAAASAKASRMAATGVFRHLGGGFGGGRAEGIGRGPTPQAALNNCCFTGQRPLLASSVVWSAKLGSYVAVKIFR